MKSLSRALLVLVMSICPGHTRAAPPYQSDITREQAHQLAMEGYRVLVAVNCPGRPPGEYHMVPWQSDLGHGTYLFERTNVPVDKGNGVTGFKVGVTIKLVRCH